MESYTVMIIAFLSSITVTCLFLLYELRQINKRIMWLYEGYYEIYSQLHFANDSHEMLLWKCMNDMSFYKQRMADIENYEMAEQYSIAIKTIENMIQYYRDYKNEKSDNSTTA